MSVPLIKIIGDAIEVSARDYLKLYIKQNHSAYLEKYTIDLDAMADTSVWRFEAEEGAPISEQVFVGVYHMYLWRQCYELDKLKSQKASYNYSEFHLKSVFKRFGYDESQEHLIAFLNRYVKALDIPWELKEHQIKKIRKAYPVTSKIPEAEDKIKSNEMADFKHRLADDGGAEWFLYFYGHEELDNPRKRDETWSLVRLVLNFKPSSEGKDLPVYITNTEHPAHPHYKGYTDLDSSTTKVLVLNLKTHIKNDSSHKLRQLNVKLFINSGEDNLFTGQYLNYEVEKGRIISGDLILERVKSETEEAIPLTYSIKEPIQDTDGYESLRHLRLLIPVLKANFRETKPVIYDAGSNEWKFSSFL